MFFKKKCPICGAKNNKERMTCIECGLPLTSGQIKGQLTEVLQEGKPALDSRLEVSPEPVEYSPNRIGKIDLSRGSLHVRTPQTCFTIERGSPLPRTDRMMFSTLMDNQEILEVGFGFVGDNLGKELARVFLLGIKPAPRGVPQIEVTINMDQDGEVSISAVDKRTARNIECEIYSSGCENIWLGS